MKKTTVKEWAEEQGICQSHARNLLNMAVYHGQAKKKKAGGVNHYRVMPNLTKNSIGLVGVTGTVRNKSED